MSIAESRRMAALTIVCKMGYLQSSLDIETRIATMRFGDVVRALESLNRANFRGLTGCCKSLSSEDRQARTYRLLRLRLQATIGDAAVCARTTVAAPLPTLSESRVVLNKIEGGPFSPLFVGTMLGLQDGVLRALKCGADPNRADNWGRTPLMKAVNGNYQSVVQLLVAEKADVNARDTTGQTALIQRAVMGHEGAMQTLLEVGADIDARDDYGQTALIRAVKGGHQAAVKLLLDRRANLEITDAFGVTASFHAHVGRNYHIMMLLARRSGTDDLKG